MKWTVGNNIGFGFGFPLLILLLIGAVAFRQTSHVSAASRMVAHSSEVLTSLGKRYAQDSPLDFGVAAPIPQTDRTRLEAGGVSASRPSRRG